MERQSPIVKFTRPAPEFRRYAASLSMRARNCNDGPFMPPIIASMSPRHRNASVASCCLGDSSGKGASPVAIVPSSYSTVTVAISCSPMKKPHNTAVKREPLKRPPYLCVGLHKCASFDSQSEIFPAISYSASLSVHFFMRNTMSQNISTSRLVSSTNAIGLNPSFSWCGFIIYPFVAQPGVQHGLRKSAEPVNSTLGAFGNRIQCVTRSSVIAQCVSSCSFHSYQPSGQ